MALRFSDFSHYSKYNGNLPGYDISGGEEVIYYWRSPYDPNLTYLHNISESNDYFQQGTYGYGLYFASNTIGGGQGVRYPRFLHDGFFNDVLVTRESINPWLTGGAQESGASTFGYLPERDMTVGYGYGWWEDWKLKFSALSGYTAFNDLHQWPRRKVLKHGRLYLQYDGGNGNTAFNYQKGINPANGTYETSIFHSSGAGNPQTDGDGLILDWVNDPEIRIFDARYLPGTNESILRENETYTFNPSPVVGQDNRGCGYGPFPINRLGLTNIPATMLPSLSGTQPSGSYVSWGPGRNENLTGFASRWGRSFSVGNGQMMFMTADDSAEIWGIAGEKNPLSHGTTGLELELVPLHGGFNFDGQSTTGKISFGDYRTEGMQESIALKHDKITYFAREEVSGNDDITRVWILNSDDSRVKMVFGNKRSVDSQQLFAVGNGRIYTVMWHANTRYVGPNYSNNNSGAMPYWRNNTYLRSNYSVEISDLGGIPRKKSFAVNGGTLLNLTSGNTNVPAKFGYVDRIAAGCGRVVLADTNYYQVNEGYYSYEKKYGKAWLYTQDGAFIKTLSFKDEMWGILGGAIGKDIRFGFKIEIANNLIFVLAPKFDLSNWITTNAGSQTWGGLGRMYIYSLDGELLSAFSGFNLGFSASFPFNFDDFCTDGVDLYIFNNQNGVYAANDTTYGKQGHGIIWANQLNQYISDGTTVVTNSGGSRVYARDRRVLVTHLRIPETISNYYDKIAETYRY